MGFASLYPSYELCRLTKVPLLRRISEFVDLNVNPSEVR